MLYSPPTTGRFDSWDDVPEEMKETYEALGIPQAEREHLAGVVGVWRQEPVYEGLKEEYSQARHPLLLDGHGDHASTPSSCRSTS